MGLWVCPVPRHQSVLLTKRVSQSCFIQKHRRCLTNSDLTGHTFTLILPLSCKYSEARRGAAQRSGRSQNANRQDSGSVGRRWRNRRNAGRQLNANANEVRAELMRSRNREAIHRTPSQVALAVTGQTLLSTQSSIN